MNSFYCYIENIENIYCHSLSVQYNTIQCYLSTECIQNHFFFISKRLYIKTRGPNCKL